MRFALMILLAIVPAAARADQTPEQQKNLGAAMLIVAAKQCSLHRNDPAIFTKGTDIARADLASTGVSQADIQKMIDAAATDPQNTANPMGCVIYDNAIESAAE